MKQPGFKAQQRKPNRKDTVNVQLDMKCSCSTATNNAIMQFSRRYLQCQSAMPIRTIRLFIESILPYSRTIKVSIFDSNNRLLKDSDRLRSLKQTTSSANHIPLRFTLINTITSLANCSCLSPSSECHPMPTTIQSDAIDQILSTYTIPQRNPTLRIDPVPSRPVPVFKRLPSNLDESTINRITLEFGEICPPLSTSTRCSNSQEYALDCPLDLSMKKHSLTPPTPWIKT